MSNSYMYYNLITWHVFFILIFVMGITICCNMTSLVLRPLAISYNTFVACASLSPRESWFYSISTNAVEHDSHFNYMKLILCHIQMLSERTFLVTAGVSEAMESEGFKRVPYFTFSWTSESFPKRILIPSGCS